MQVIQVLRDVLLSLIGQDENWLRLFKHHGWHIESQRLSTISADDLTLELVNTRLNIDRSSNPFKDFHLNSEALILPGQPNASFLYHALASPSVTVAPDGTELTAFPSASDIEAVENAIYALKQATLESLAAEASALLGSSVGTEPELAVVLFALEYRHSSAGVHRLYSDLNFSRTGVARVGNQSAHYDAKMRGHRTHLDGDKDSEIRVVPCRYVPYIAVRSKGRKDRFGPAWSSDQADGDAFTDFWVPLHKVFNGSECLLEQNIALSFDHAHFNQKVERLAKVLHEKAGNAIDPDAVVQPPFRISEGLAEISDAATHGSGLLVPKVNPLVAEAKIGDNFVAFNVPPMNQTPGFYAAFAPTLSLDSGAGGSRPWPEYAHVRTEVLPDGSVSNFSNDVNVVDKATEGHFNALHYIDFAADGWVTVNLAKPLTLAGRDLAVVPAYSLVTAPDFFPKVRQRQVYEWWNTAPQIADQLPGWWQRLIAQGAWRNIWRAKPEPLSDMRVASNINLPNSPFDPNEQSNTAIVCQLNTDLTVTRSAVDAFFGLLPYSQRASALPDAAAGFFAPGWDTSFDITDGTQHLAAYGLGSPFPEDAKLCAALSTFWPAAAPDTQRTFFTVPHAQGTVAPLTDAEIGTTPNGIPWDGVVGPVILHSTPHHTLVDYPDYPRADYTMNAFAGRYSLALTKKITLEEYKRRILAMLRCYAALNMLKDKNAAHVLSFRIVDSFNAELDEAQTTNSIELTGTIYRIEGFNDEFDNTRNYRALAHPTDHNRAHYEVRATWIAFVGQGDFVLLRRFKLGDGSLVQAGWEVVDA